MDNGISTLEKLFATHVFRIPEYQRAYAWEREPQLEAFLEDLRQQAQTQASAPDKPYFLGTFLLHEEDLGRGRTLVNVVDGQQRMTTAVVFVATALALEAQKKIAFTTERAALLKRTFIFDADSELQKFRTIEGDEPFFKAEILRISRGATRQDSPSARRLQAAAAFFAESVRADEWEPLLLALRTARVMVYAVQTAEDATQIFELQNDRGKSLTSLEALKSYLMHCIYLHSAKGAADDRLRTLQTQFAKIFRAVEELEDLHDAPGEDALLAYHCAAFLRWGSREDYSNPKRLVKATIKTMDKPSVIGWIEQFVGQLVESYAVLTALLRGRDELAELSELLLVRRMAPFWPLILKAWVLDTSPEKTSFLKACRLLEVFSFRGYAIANLRSDTSLSTLHIMARDFSGDFEVLFTRLAEMSGWYDLENRFVAGLDNPRFFEAEGGDCLYLLWRYENWLRRRPGQQQPPLSWRDIVDPHSYAAKFSVEHIAAQSSEMNAVPTSWRGGDPSPFADVALHRLGNLVIDSISTNASKGNKDFTDKLRSLSEGSTYLSQGELLRFVTDGATPRWDVEAVTRRHDALLAFAKKIWSPDSWHQGA